MPEKRIQPSTSLLEIAERELTILNGEKAAREAAAKQNRVAHETEESPEALVVKVLKSLLL